MIPKKTKPTKEPTRGYIDARFVGARLVNEQAITETLDPKKMGKDIKVSAESRMDFAIGLADIENPTGFAIDITHNIILFEFDTRNQIASYNAKHIVQFSIVRSIGVTDWTNIDRIILESYFHLSHRLGINRAEQTFTAMGFKGVELPKDVNFADLKLNTPTLGS